MTHKSLLFSLDDRSLVNIIQYLQEKHIETKTPVNKSIFLQEIEWALLEIQINKVISDHVKQNEEIWTTLDEEILVTLTEFTDWPQTKQQFLSVNGKEKEKYLKVFLKFHFISFLHIFWYNRFLDWVVADKPTLPELFNPQFWNKKKRKVTEETIITYTLRKSTQVTSKTSNIDTKFIKSPTKNMLNDSKTEIRGIFKSILDNRKSSLEGFHCKIVFLEFPDLSSLNIEKLELIFQKNKGFLHLFNILGIIVVICALVDIGSHLVYLFFFKSLTNSGVFPKS